MKLEYKTFPTTFTLKKEKEDDKERGIIEAYVSIFNNVDSMNERVLKGAFKKSLEKKLPKGVWSHKWDEPIAKTLEAEEDDKGLRIKGKLILGVQRAREVYELLKEGVIDEFSIGYRVVKDQIRNGIRELKEVELYEWSPVLVGANDKTELVDIKDGLSSLGFKGVIPYKKYPKAPEDTEWDALEEVKKADIDDLKEMCAWYDSEYPDVKSSYKLPHHLKDGYKTVWRGVAAAMAALLGARGGVNIPEKDKRGVYNHLVKHYQEFDKEPPQFDTEKVDEGKEEKEGRVLSGRNREIIKRAIEILQELYDATEPPAKNDAISPDKKGEKVEPQPEKIIRIRQAAKQADKSIEYLLRIIKEKK